MNGLNSKDRDGKYHASNNSYAVQAESEKLEPTTVEGYTSVGMVALSSRHRRYTRW
jgi:hypothetical protein